MGYAATRAAVGISIAGPVLTQQILTYSTNFPATENPISQGNRWVNGLALGQDWCDVRTTPGKAFGTQAGSPPPFDDSVALLLPASGQVWSPDQEVIGRVFITDRTGWNSFKEVECHLRATMIAGRLYTYEVLFSVIAGTTYIDIVRWNGVVGQELADYVFLNSKSDFSGLSHGHFVRATILGSLITAYTSTNGVDWTQQLQADIITDAGDGVFYATGNPGIGFWNREPTNGANDTFGFSQLDVAA